MKICKGQKGFTLAEMMVAVAISGIVLGGVYTAFVAQRQGYDAQEQVTDVQQNMRAAMYMMTREIRLAGYDPTFTRLFRITDIRFRDINNALDLNGSSAITFTLDVNGDGDAETISYSIYDFPVAAPDGNLDLARDEGGGRQLIAENIIAMGLAYAYDSDGDGNLDTYAAGGSNAVIWAIDSDNDNTLNLNLDTDADGDIDEDDGPGLGGSGTIGGTAIIPVVSIDKIRAVKIWLLVRSFRQDAGGFVDTKTYVVGNRVITPNTNFRHRLLHTTVYCRNLGLD
jgi:type IV pilus assembly protein PilW